MLPLCLPCKAININGTYTDEYGNKIVISGSKFVYIEKAPSTHNTWENDTLAECIIKKISNNILKINSLDIYDTLYKTMEMHYSQTYSKDDSIKVVIECPYAGEDLNISISREGNFPSESYNNSRNCNYIYIPKNTKEIMLYIYPNSTKPIHTIRGQSFGLQELRFLAYLDDEKGDVIIKIPILNNHFFEKYFIANEYVYIEEKKYIHWKGNIYKKEN